MMRVDGYGLSTFNRQVAGSSPVISEPGNRGTDVAQMAEQFPCLHLIRITQSFLDMGRFVWVIWLL